MKTKLRVDSRDLHHHDFGSINIFLPVVNFDDGLTNPIEAPTEIDCTAISTCDVCGDQTKKVYDYIELWAKVPHSSQGADPRDTLGVMISNGLLISGTLDRDKNWNSYFRGDTDKTQIDAVASVKSAMTIAQSSITAASNWYNNWDFVTSEGTLPSPDYIVSGHDYKICGWDDTKGFRIKHWLGFKVWMPYGIFNYVISQAGCGTYMPSTIKINAIRGRTLQEWLLDSIQNLLLLFKQMYVQIYGKLYAKTN